MPANTDLVAALRKPVAVVLAATLAAVLLSPALPRIALDTGLADFVVRITDTATWPQMVYVTAGAVVLLISRAGLSARRRGLEASTLVIVTLIILVGGAALNEHVVKPAFAVPRPNIVRLADAGALGPDIPDAAAFYATGNKEARRDVLGERLPDVPSPALSGSVRAHWAHETGFSFPSGHSTAAMALAAMLVALGFAWLTGWRRLVASILFPAWAVAAVYSRTILEVHTAADVVAGTITGFAWGLVAFWAVLRTVEAGQKTLGTTDAAENT